jgi:predicted TIM-barrel fold metal-dependent hydrolase
LVEEKPNMSTNRESFSIGRRTALQALAGGAVAWASGIHRLGAEDARVKNLVIDTHMHVWAKDLQRFPFAHPYDADFRAPNTAATVELLVEEMDAFGVTHCVLVQTIYHGWDNRYLAECVKAHPKRFKGQGLIDPTDPRVAEKLDYWMTEYPLSGMRFSPIYYLENDQWLDAPASDDLWRTARKHSAIFNYFIATTQLPRLENRIQKYPDVRVVIDHLARIDLKLQDPLPEFQKLLRLAQYPNVWVKVSELSVLSPSGAYPYRDTFAYVRRLADAFGPDRLLWGTGFPSVTRTEAGRPTLEQELALVRREIDFFTDEDRAKILGTNAATLWGFA